jgi:hypothetical protein
MINDSDLILAAINLIDGYFPEVDRAELVFMLYEFEELHGKTATRGLIGFVKFAQANDLRTGLITSTIGHDLNGRRDKHMSPRSYSYA